MRKKSRPTDPAVVALWQQVPFLTQLDPVVLDDLAACGLLQRHGAGEIIFMEGDAVPALFLIEEGAVKISRFSREGREHIVHLLGRGDTFNDVAALDGGPTPATAMAHTDVQLWRVDRAALHDLALRHPAFTWAILEGMTRRARRLVSIVQDFSMRNVKGRLARLLLDEARAAAATGDEAVGDGSAGADIREIAAGAEVPMNVTQEEMASRLGTVREVVGRALRNLHQAGIIEAERQRIVILDPERLAEEAEI